MHKLRWALLLQLLCSSLPAGAQTDWKKIVDIQVTEIEFNQQGIILDQASFAQQWKRWQANKPLPKIDFEKFAVLWVLAEKRPTLGYTYCPEKMVHSSDVVKVFIKESAPDPDAFLPLRAHQPGCFVQIPRAWASRLRFEISSQNLQQRKQLPLRKISQQSTSLILEQRQVVVRDQESFKLLWRQHQGSLDYLPDVDFRRDMVVAIFMGEQPTGGYEVEIIAVEETAETIVIKYKLKEPDSNFMVIQMLTAPVHMVVVPAREGEVLFQAVSDNHPAQ